jgi:transcriptional regulator with XRE-family HTH domain
MMNFKLLQAIRENGLTQREFAAIVGDHESVVSRIVNGTWNLDQAGKIRYAKALKRKPGDLFETAEERTRIRR